MCIRVCMGGVCVHIYVWVYIICVCVNVILTTGEVLSICRREAFFFDAHNL